MKLNKLLTKEEAEALDKRWNELSTKRYLTEAEEAEFGAIIRTSLRTRPDLFTELPHGMWALTKRMTEH